ncbi:hypothetical protein G5S52_00885 [Grimontia sp. S25]|uniref:Uncharacterized protein n=1 Tax=Grimontia sedimenti TaxID=2711294 RepID=A0A6M1RFA8_9GAMM|nr:ETEC_3214 domain-containing protein [Grimontia sedimenti]NGN96258.1 hypothetical protein [Grimontia sedimenti]
MSVLEAEQQISDESNESAEQTRLRDKVRQKWARMIAVVSIVAIALGGLNDTFDAIEKIYNLTLSQFTDIPSHNKLNRIYIRASEGVLEETFGAPVYIKENKSGEQIKYYHDSRFILSVITKNGAIAAFLVFPEDGFIPDTREHSGGELLMERVLSNNEEVIDIRVSYSRSVSYYLEENPTGEYSNLYSSVAGFSEYHEPLDIEKRRLLFELSDAIILEEYIKEKAVALRENVTPNFYGYSTQGLESLEQAILTLTEYRLISKQ